MLELIAKGAIAVRKPGDAGPVSVSLFGKTFNSVGAILDWISRLPYAQARINVWVDVVTQLSRFFRSGSSMAAVISKAVRSDKAFKTRKWSEKELSDLLHPLEIHVDAAKTIRYRDQEALKTIRTILGT